MSQNKQTKDIDYENMIKSINKDLEITLHGYEKNQNTDFNNSKFAKNVAFGLRLAKSIIKINLEEHTEHKECQKCKNETITCFPCFDKINQKTIKNLKKGETHE